MTTTNFDEIHSWEDGLRFVHNVVRQHLVASQLRGHLPPIRQQPLIVDLGCGQGTQALELAKLGYQVVGVDPSERLLRRARRDLGSLPRDVRTRASFVQGDLDHLEEVVVDPIDVLLCHGVLMYFPSLIEPLGTLAAALADGGMLSILTRNQAGLVMRAGMSHEWVEAVDTFDSRYYENRLGITDVRADAPEDVIHACEHLGLTVESWYGVRLFTDHWDDTVGPEELESLLAAEEQAGRRDPYRRLAALTHVIARC